MQLVEHGISMVLYGYYICFTQHIILSTHENTMLHAPFCATNYGIDNEFL
jgi:hypothetical protein